jgi:hypothetical protein
MNSQDARPGIEYGEKIELELPFLNTTTRTFVYGNEYEFGSPVVKVWLPKGGNLRRPTPTVKITIEFSEGSDGT